MVPPDPVPGLYLLPLDDSFFPPKRIALPPGTRVRIGRQLNQKSAPGAGNGVFESRVLSRQHAEAWIEGGRMLIRDVKSSNGTFVNGERLSLEGAESDPFELRSDDILEFGIDIVGEHGEVVHRKVAARVTCAFTPTDAQRAVRAETRVYPPPTVPSTPPPVPPLPPNIHDLNSGSSNSNGAASGSPDAPRRPQHGTGLAGMGGMGAERIRPKSGVDFDSIIARIRDGPSAAALAALSNPTLVSSVSAPATVSIPTLGSPVPPFIPPTASMPTSSSAMSVPMSSGANNESSNDMNTTQTNATDGGEAEGDPHAAALAQLRAELASTQAALEEAVRAAAGLVISTAGQGSASPSDVLSDSADHDAAHSDSVPSSDPSSPHADSPSATPHGDSYPTPDSSHDGASPLHASTLSLRAELAALRTEASELQRARSRRARAQTIIPSSYSPADGGATVKEKGKGKAAQTSAAWSLGTVRRTRLGVDALEDLEIDGGGLSLQDTLAGDGDGEDEEGDGDGDGDEEGGQRRDEDWADDIDFGAEVAEMTPTPTLSRSTFRSAGVEGAAGWRGLRGVFDVDDDEGFPSSLTAMHTSPTRMDHGNGVGGGREEEGEEGRGEAADGEEAEHLRALSAQLDAVSVQLGTLHGRLAALQSASVSTSPTTASPTLESVGAIDGGKTTEGEKAAVDGGRLEGLEGRVRALEGAVISAAPSPPTSNDDTAAAAPAHAISIDGEAKEIQASLAEGLAALQAEWAAFRAEAASYDPSSAAAMTAAVAPAGVYALRGLPEFARGLDVNVGAASRPYASGSSLGPGAAMGRATFGRRSGRKWMEMYDPGADAGGDSSSSLSDTDGPVGSDSGDEAQDAPRPPRHARQAAEGDDDDARIPGRWGLLTPEGSMRGGALAATPTALWNAAKSNALDAWANGTHLGPESAMQSAQLSTGAGGLPSGAAKTRSVRPTKRGGEAQGWARTQTDAEQTLLLAGAVGAGVMIVVAAWWGA